jgi:Putative Ig domain
MKPRGPVLTVLAIGLLLLLSGPSASAFPGQTSTRTLRFITTGLVCSGGVCALGSGKVGANYGQDIAITGESCGSPCSTLPVFTVVAGSLPPGLFMPSTYGCCGDAIGGTPSQVGVFTFKIQVRDGAGDTARHGFSIAIRAAAP